MHRFTGLWRHRDFMKLWGGQAVSNLGSHVGGGALRFTAILLLAATPWQLSLLTVAALLPTLLLSLFAGLWVDRVRRRPLLIGADLGRALALLTIPLAAMSGVLRIEHLYAVAGVTGGADDDLRNCLSCISANADRARTTAGRQQQIGR